MDTTYYSFETRKIKVSGGTDLLTIVPAAAPAPTAPAGEVLDFDRCRRKLETKAAWKGLTRAVAEVKVPAAGDAEEAAYEAAAPAPARRAAAEGRPALRRENKAPAVRTPRVGKAVFRALQAGKAHKAFAPRPERAGGWLELLSSLAVILVCLCAGWGFLALV